LINNPRMRIGMGHQAFREAQQHSWYEAMEYLIEGYDEVSSSTRARTAA
jgi:uncharacterized protein YukE